MPKINSEILLDSTQKIMQNQNRYEAVRQVIACANELSVLYKKNKISALSSTIVKQAIFELKNKQ